MIIVISIKQIYNISVAFPASVEPLFCQQIAPLRRNKPTAFETFF